MGIAFCAINSKDDLVVPLENTSANYFDYHPDFHGNNHLNYSQGASNFVAKMYIFAQEWPGNYRKVPVGINYFTIHGLWPQESNGFWPEFGCKRKADSFNSSIIKSLKEQILLYWPDLKPSSSNEYWFYEHEWNMHGSCSTWAYEEIVFFRTALSLPLNFNVKKALDKAGIKTDNTYKLDQFHNAIKDAFGAFPIIVCSDKNKTKKTTIMEIRMCLNLDLKAFDCSQKLRHIDEETKNCVDNAPDGIYYPAIED